MHVCVSCKWTKGLLSVLLMEATFLCMDKLFEGQNC